MLHVRQVGAFHSACPADRFVMLHRHSLGHQTTSQIVGNLVFMIFKLYLRLPRGHLGSRSSGNSGSQI